MVGSSIRLMITRLVRMRKIKEKLEEPIYVKRGTLLLWALAGFGCGAIFMFMFALLGMV